MNPALTGNPGIEENAKNTNPNFYSKKKGSEYYRDNCQKCVPAFELRMRGYDVQAKWYDHDNRNSNEDWLEHHPFSAFIDAKVETVPLGMNAYDVISKALQEYGIGSRIEISYYRKMRDYGHVIVGYNDMGKPRFIDVQEGTTFALEKMHDIINVSYARIDNLRINELFLADVCEWRPKR